MPNSPSTSPPSKRFKLEDSEHEDEEGLASPVAVEGQDEDSDTNCSICLQPMEDRTVIPTCSHEFCFDCLMIWTGTLNISFKRFCRIFLNKPFSPVASLSTVHSSHWRLRHPWYTLAVRLPQTSSYSSEVQFSTIIITSPNYCCGWSSECSSSSPAWPRTWKGTTRNPQWTWQTRAIHCNP
jgi:hypothetical protein